MGVKMGEPNKHYGKAVVKSRSGLSGGEIIGYIDDSGHVRESPFYGSNLVKGDNSGYLFVGGDGKIHENAPMQPLGTVDCKPLNIRGNMP